MTNPSIRDTHLFDITDLYYDINNHTLPAVSFVKPRGWSMVIPRRRNGSSTKDSCGGFLRRRDPYPLIAISPYTHAGHISHTYSDHVSVLKFIEHNWNLPTISSPSRDNLPNPTSTKSNPYVPTNSPAIGDLFDLFDFSKNP